MSNMSMGARDWEQIQSLKKAVEFRDKVIGGLVQLVADLDAVENTLQRGEKVLSRTITLEIGSRIGFFDEVEILKQEPMGIWPQPLRTIHSIVAEQMALRVKGTPWDEETHGS